LNFEQKAERYDESSDTRSTFAVMLGLQGMALAQPVKKKST
jgi:hypothetical protein